jgi:small GTP-binding protein
MAATGRELKLKVCTVGPPGVGKSSLTRRFVYNVFSDVYLTTLGANMAKKVVEVTPEGQSEPWTITMVVWDIMGQRTFLDLVKEAYFQGTHGIMAVADLTRPETFADANVWIGAVREVAGADLPTVLLGNKIDAVDLTKVDISALEASAQAHRATLRFTSASTGEHVEDAFREIGARALANYLARDKPHRIEVSG